MPLLEHRLDAQNNEEFRICYQSKKGHYLAPQLFNSKPLAYDWDHKNNLSFQYNYVFMPKGILSQLIVVLHKNICGDVYWKHGVLLEYKNTKAIVTEKRFKNENRISIKIVGEQKRELLAIIGNELDEINGSFTNLDLSKAFSCNCDECRVSETPYFIPINRIELAIKKGKVEIECQQSFDDVKIDKLIDSFVSRESLQSTNKRGDFEGERSNVFNQYNFHPTRKDDSLNEKIEQHFEKVHDHLEKQDESLESIQRSVEKIQVHLLKDLPTKVRDAVYEEIEFLILNNSSNQADKMIEWLELAFDAHQQVVTEEVLEGMKALQKSKLFETKVKLAVPLIGLFGVKIETAFDLKRFLENLDEYIGQLRI